MARLYFLIAAAAFVAIAFAKPEYPGFKLVDDIIKFGADNSCTKLEPAIIESAKFHYLIGARKNGDRQLANHGDYSSGKGYCAQDYEIRFNFPPPGYETSAITYGDITVEQNSSISNVYVTSGGLGQNYISILIEAKNSTFLNTKIMFFGI